MINRRHVIFSFDPTCRADNFILITKRIRSGLPLYLLDRPIRKREGKNIGILIHRFMIVSANTLNPFKSFNRIGRQDIFGSCQRIDRNDGIIHGIHRLCPFFISGPIIKVNDIPVIGRRIPCIRGIGIDECFVIIGCRSGSAFPHAPRARFTDPIKRSAIISFERPDLPAAGLHILMINPHRIHVICFH